MALEGPEDRLLDVVGHARPLIGHRDHEVVPVLRDLDLNRGARGCVVGCVLQQVVDDARGEPDIEIGGDGGGRQGEELPAQPQVTGPSRDERREVDGCAPHDGVPTHDPLGVEQAGQDAAQLRARRDEPLGDVGDLPGGEIGVPVQDLRQGGDGGDRRREVVRRRQEQGVLGGVRLAQGRRGVALEGECVAHGEAGLLALADVAQRAAQPGRALPGPGERHHGDLHRKITAVAAPHAADRGGGPPFRARRVLQRVHRGPIFGVDEAGQGPALELLRGAGEHAEGGRGCVVDATAGVGGDDHVRRRVREEPVPGLARRQRPLRGDARALVADEPAHADRTGVARATGREMDRGRERPPVRRHEAGLEADDAVGTAVHRIVEPVEHCAPGRVVDEDDRGLVVEEAGRASEQLAGRPIRLDDDPVGVRDEIPVRSEVEQFAVTGHLGIEVLLGLGQRLVLGADLLCADLELQQGGGELVEDVGHGRPG